MTSIYIYKSSVYKNKQAQRKEREALCSVCAQAERRNAGRDFLGVIQKKKESVFLAFSSLRRSSGS